VHLLILSQKYGRANEKTPAKWNASYKDYGANGQTAPMTMAETTTTSEVLAAPAIPPTGLKAEDETMAGASAEMEPEEKSKKRKSRGDENEGGSAEDKAERKRLKKEKKEAKKEKKEKKDKKRKAAESDSEED
jgi:H/ACA ribonucleoprotein complex subunit 4